MDPKTGTILIEAVAIAGLVAALAVKDGSMTAEDIKASADAIRAQEQRLASMTEITDPEVIKGLPTCPKDAKPIGCQPEVNDLVTRVSYYRCDCVMPDGAVAATYCDERQEEDARAALKDEREKPALVRVAPPPKEPVDPHPRDMSVPVYGKAGGAVAEEQPKEIEKP
jgi:hypothetical protein